MKKIEKYEIVNFGIAPEEFFTKSPQFLNYSQNNGYKYDIAYIGFGPTEVSALEDALEQAVLDDWDVFEALESIKKSSSNMKHVALVPEREDEGYWVGFSVCQIIPD